MTPKILRDVVLGDTLVRLWSPPDDDAAPGLVLAPAGRSAELVGPRPHLTAPAVTSLPARWLPLRAWEIEPLVQLRRRGEAAPGGFAHGRTLRGSPSTQALRLREPVTTQPRANGHVTVRTQLASPDGLAVVHELASVPGSRALEVRTAVTNGSGAPVTLELLSSFCLGGITPFAADDAAGRLVVHRYRSAWSGEGRRAEETLEQLHLERSWTGHSVQTERIGAVGSMPVQAWFPCLVIEDRTAGVWWAATLEAPGSWQIELHRRADQLAISGGLADREHGHWSKQLAPGETFAAPVAWLAVSDRGADDACDRLQDPLRHARTAQPPAERTLPITFNEWCTSWGNPTHDNLVALADRLAGSGVRYLVIDDGWARRSPGALLQENGDWIVDDRRFPHGLGATVEAIRARGLVPGIWFEFESVNAGSQAWDRTEHFLHRDGVPLQVGNRRFWDFRDPWVHDYLAERVIGLLRRHNFGYLKIDHNDSVGLGCDEAESLGEGLRQHLAGVHAFLARLRRELPDLVIENCSSGGHRLEPSWMALTAMSSITDAHETPDIPLLAANLIPLVPASQRQIWAVVRSSDSAARLSYSLAALFLGRVCLSGEVHGLTDGQWDFVRRALARYQAKANLIGTCRMSRHGAWGESYQHPTGCQAVVCADLTGKEAFVVWHAFAAPPTRLDIPLPGGAASWVLDDELCDRPGGAALGGPGLRLNTLRPWSGGVVFLSGQSRT